MRLFELRDMILLRFFLAIFKFFRIGSYQPLFLGLQVLIFYEDN